MATKTKKHPPEVTGPRFTSMVTEVPPLRKFYLEREEDVSGLSGTGIVAVGVMFPSGMCIMEWVTPIKSFSHYHSIADLEALHGHQGRTQVKWVEGAM